MVEAFGIGRAKIGLRDGVIGAPMEAMATPVAWERIAEAGAAEGLEVLASLSPVPQALDPTGLDRLIADGVGDMGWLKDHRDLRLNPEGLMPGAQGALLAMLPYHPQLSEDQSLKRARYAAGRDYHKYFRKKLTRLGNSIPDLGQTRACVDSAPVNERTLARIAGIGWIGRNGLLIVPKRGSYGFLGVLLTQAPLEPYHPGNDANRCGSCTACETLCPTKALVNGRVISERCISYLTIEYHGVIPKDLASNFEGWWYGCDRCQEVCPWNRFAPDGGEWCRGTDLEQELLDLRREDFDAHFAGRPQRRIGYDRFRRNLLVALWSLGQADRFQVRGDDADLITTQYLELLGRPPMSPPRS